MSEIKYFELMFARLEPRSEWRGGRMADTDVLTLEDAVRFASLHSGEEVTPGDVLRAAARREILLHAIVHRTAKVHAHDGGIYCNKGTPTENLVPAGSIPTLPLSACQSLAATGRASWRTFDGIKTIDGEMVRFTVAALDDGEPDFETVPADCRVTGYDVHALADAYCDTPEDEPQAAAPEPTATDFAMLASREQLIAAFGTFTGMNADWFNNIKDKPALLAARRITGQGGRGHLAEPYFCPFAVMEWLVNPTRRTGRPMREAKGWELLERHFPMVYASRSIGDPRDI